MIEKLAQVGLKLKPRKCEFFFSGISYLGHIVLKNGIETDPKKIQAIVKWLKPTTITDVCSFLGFANHYGRFLHKYAHIMRPLDVLISGKNANEKKQAIEWNDDCERAFQELKQLCSNMPVLAYAHYSKPFKLCTDACNLELGAVLYQMDEDGLDRVIVYTSRTLSKSERNYPAYKLEFLALEWAITVQFHEYLYG